MKSKPLKVVDLLKEKNLWHIYLATWKLKDSKFNWIVGLFVMAVGIFYSWVEEDTKLIHELLLKMAEFGFNASISLLGFLIAGFTIFASLAKPGLLLTMLKHKHRPSGISYLKYNFFTLIRTFLYLLIFATFQLCVIALGQDSGVIGAFSEYLFNDKLFLSYGTRLMLICSFTLWAVSMLQLKSFVFNVHHFVFTMIKYDAISYNDSLDDLKNEADDK